MESTTEANTNQARPPLVTRAVALLASSLAIGLLSAILRLAQRTSGATFLFALLIVVAFFGLLLFLVMKIAAGRNWARIILLMLVLFGTPFAIPGYLQEIRRNALAGTLGFIITLLQLLGTWLLFKKQSNLWFKTRK